MKARFAPSPTGYLHVGGARTALFNWLIVQKAKRSGEEASFLLRIEDTDTERNKPEWTQGIIDSLLALGLNWDEGPIFQSSRVTTHKQTALDLFDANLAYWCRCTKEDIENRNSGKNTVGYDRHCRSLNLKYETGYALRFKVPLESATKFHDSVRGDVQIENTTLEDFVLLKGNLSPLFVLANTVDDMDLGVTHVVRGEEHLYNTFKIILLWEAISKLNDSNATEERPLPTFAHLPLLVNEKRQKLSKRRDKVSVEEFFDMGFLPEAMLNYLALLGWGPKNNQEILSVDELIDQFDLNDVNLAPAFFDIQKLNHFNNIYIRDMDVDLFRHRALDYLKIHSGLILNKLSDTDINEILELVQPRINTLSEIEKMIGFFIEDEVAIPQDLYDKTYLDPANKQILLNFKDALKDCEFSKDELHKVLESIGLSFGKKLGKSQAPIRLALTGSNVGPPLFESLMILGKDKTLARLDIVAKTFLG